MVAESFPHLNLGAIRDFKSILISSNYWKDDCWNEGKHIYTFSTGSFVEFVSFDKFGKAHGPRRDVLFVNEANNLPYNIVDQLITRTRETIWLDWNPTREFWFYTEMLNKRNDIDFLTLNYLDMVNIKDGKTVLTGVTITEIESHKSNKNWWQVYGLGELGDVETKIYKDWEFLDEIPHQARLERYGLDFGYTNDPSSLIAIHYFQGGYILHEHLFLKGMSNKQIADTLLNLPKALVIADSAEPKSIDEIKSYGINILGAEKGPDSVRSGIQLVQSQKISITKSSVNLIKEYRNYLWLTDKDGVIQNEPDHFFSHSMDAIRYGLTSIIKKPKINMIASPLIKPYSL